MASGNPEVKSFLHIGAPDNGLFMPSESSRVGYYPLRTIDNDYRIGLVADKLGTNKLLAKTLLSQIEMGNVQLQYLDKQVREQGETNVELRNLVEMGNITHKSIENFTRQHEVKMDMYVEETVRAAYGAAAQVSGSLDEGFDRTVDAIHESAEMVAVAIGIATETLHADLQGIGAILMVSNETLKEIANILKTPGDTKVNELLERSGHLIDAGMQERGKWRYENWRDALSALVEASQCALGKTNPMVWFQIGFLTWKCNERSKNDATRFAKLSEARDAFDHAARLFTKSKEVYFTKSIRHKAHMQYLLGDYKGALGTLKPIFSEVRMHVDAGIELARYYELCGMRKEALVHVSECIRVFPTFSVSLFAEPDFLGMTRDIIGLVASHRELLKQQMPEVLAQFNTVVLHEQAGLPLANLRVGSYEQHHKARKFLTALLRAKSYIQVHHLATRMKLLFKEMNETPTSPLEQARIMVFYGAKNQAAKLVTVLMDEHREVVSAVIVCKVLSSINELIGPELAKHTQYAHELATNALAQLERIASEQKRFREEANFTAVYTADYLAVIARRAGMTNTNFTDALLLLEEAKKLATESFALVRSRLLSEIAAEAGIFTFEVQDAKDNAAHLSYQKYLFRCMCLFTQEFPELCTDNLRIIGGVYTAVNQYNATHELGAHAITVQSENGLGRHCHFEFRHNGQVYPIKFFAPHVKVAKLFSKAVPFTVGDHIEFWMLVEDIFKYLKDPKIRTLVTELFI